MPTVTPAPSPSRAGSGGGSAAAARGGPPGLPMMLPRPSSTWCGCTAGTGWPGHCWGSRSFLTTRGDVGLPVEQQPGDPGEAGAHGHRIAVGTQPGGDPLGVGVGGEQLPGPVEDLPARRGVPADVLVGGQRRLRTPSGRRRRPCRRRRPGPDAARRRTAPRPPARTAPASAVGTAGRPDAARRGGQSGTGPPCGLERSASTDWRARRHSPTRRLFQTIAGCQLR